jgi:cellulose synthase/poly-beta-1,6-N-acetylglucosamine synthase-like glycosyltransferase
LLAVLALALLLAAKIEFKNPDSNDAFYAYGLLVTAVVFVIMTVSLAFYQDPAVVARARIAAGDIQMKDSLISCIVAVHNEEELVTECIVSMLSQTYSNTEVIVVDDASTDGTVGVLRKLSQRYGFSLTEDYGFLKVP